MTTTSAVVTDAAHSAARSPAPIEEGLTALEPSMRLAGSDAQASAPAGSLRKATIKRIRPNVLKLAFFEKPLVEKEPASSPDPVSAPTEENWDISVGERKVGSKGNKRPLDPGVILSVTSPTSSLTLVRSVSQVAQLDQQLREKIDPEKLPAYDPLPLLSFNRLTRRGSKRSVLAALSRTFTAAKQRNASGNSSRTESSEDDDAAELVLESLSTYFNQLAKIPSVRAQAVWKDFFSASGAEDLALERKAKKARGDGPLETLESSTDESDVEILTPMDVDQQSISRDSAIIAAVKAEVALSAMRGPSARSSFNRTKADTPSPEPVPVVTPVPESSSLVAVPKDVSKEEEAAQSKAAAQQPSVPASGSGIVKTDEPIDAGEAKSCASSRSSSPSPSASLSVAAVSAVEPISSKSKRTSIADFDILRVLGKGCAGKVLLVRHKTDKKTYALKSILKKHVLGHREVRHTMAEQRIFAELSSQQQPDGKHGHPFIAHLQYSFRDSVNLYLCLDFYSGGDLATQLARWGVLGRDRARFYSCEIAVGLEALHKAGIIYRDLKPENVLIARDGHIVLTDFGLSKQLSKGSLQETSTFCGTAEYLAPEVLLGDRYTFAVDWYSFGTMLYEMLFGKTPFYAETHREMYRKIVEPTEKLTFPDTVHGAPFYSDETTRNFIRGLLNRDPRLRIGDKRVRTQPYFSMIRWEFVETRRYRPPFVPDTNPDDDADTTNFDKTYLEMKPSLSRSYDEKAKAKAERTAEERKKAEGARDTEGGAGKLGPPESATSEEPRSAKSDNSSEHSRERRRSDGTSENDEHSEDDDSEARDSDEYSEDYDSERSDESSDGDDTGSKAPQLPFDDNGNDVFDGYSFKSPDAISISEASTEESTSDEPEKNAVPVVKLDAPSKDSTAPSDLSSVGGTHASQDQISRSYASVAPATGENASSTRQQRGKGLDSLAETANEEERAKVSDEWDVIENARYIGEAGNGTRAGPRSLFARGVVDKYRMQLSSTIRSSPKRSPYKRTSRLFSGRSSQREAGDMLRADSQVSSHSSSDNHEDAASASARTSPAATMLAALRRPALMERTSSAIGFAMLRPKRSRHSTADSANNSAAASRMHSGTTSPVSEQPENTLVDTPAHVNGQEQTTPLARSRDLEEVVEEPAEMTSEEHSSKQRDQSTVKKRL